ncbi:hypothetical protein GCM10007877_21940 [Marinibactrum halimedae]|uniref:Uncharacterized protein n=1 Tax=Marinibactrum halimedae TaxID=1444977 RepID=A0AA37WML5_9GAMM|nr:hypothetical protein GCM10007877_21940 [Marinibactrum halimedae]
MTPRINTAINDKKLIPAVFITIATIWLQSCVVLPKSDNAHQAKCEISSDRKTLRVVNLVEETNSFYSIEGVIATPIIYPTTAILSGTYVAVNNIYHLGEEKIKCSK